MKHFSDCVGKCCICDSADFNCLAGINDDHYGPATKEQVISRLNEGRYPSYRQDMIKYLQDEFNYEYIGG